MFKEELKYRKSEQVKVDYYNREIDRYDKMLDKHSKKMQIFEEKQQQKQNEIDGYRGEMFDKITTIDKAVKKRCKHKGERCYWANCRDDASFEKYCGCVDCGEIMWDECK